jgi:uncharacterized SAM-binding protein YcdF (DUF218 family)
MTTSDPSQAPDAATDAAPPPPAQFPRLRERVVRAVIPGMAVGALCGWLFSELTFADRMAGFIVLGAVLLCGWLSTTRLRGLVAAAGALAVIAILVIGFTPLVPWLLHGPPNADPLEKCDAVVSLSAGINQDDTLAAGTQDRALHSFALLRAGWAPRLVLTGNESQGESLIRREMNALGLNFPIENSGPVIDTHDESVTVARLVRERGWRRVILVTHDWHMPRAAAAFEKAGVDVLRSPCPDSRCDMHHPNRLPDRIRALACIIHEMIGYRMYRIRGWV